MQFIRRHPAMVTVNAAYLAAAGVGVMMTGNLEFAFYLITLLGIIAGVLMLHHRIGFSPGVLWALTLWGGAHMAGGLVPVPPGIAYHGDTPVLYSMWLAVGWLKYDHVVHAWGFGTATVCCWQGLQRMLGDGARPTAGKLLLCAMAGCGLGAANEIVEFLATVLAPKTNVGGYVNTSLDLVSNAVGAAGAAVTIGLGWIGNPPHRRPT